MIASAPLDSSLIMQPVTRSVVGLSLILTVIEVALRAKGDAQNTVQSLFMTVPGTFAPWTLLTAPYCGRRPALAAVHIVFLYAALQYFERAWGSRSLGKYVLLVSVVPVLVAYLVDTVLGVEQPIGGATPLVVAFLVALKQANPFTYKFYIEIKPKYLVMPALAFYTILGVLDLSFPIMAWTSLAISWWYLRFIKSLVMDQLDGPSRTKGDRSDAFRFSKFFYPRQLTNALLSIEQRLETSQPTAAPALHTTQADRQRALGQQVLRG